MEKDKIPGIIDRFDGDKVVVKTENGDEILLPKSNLSDELLEGDAIEIRVYSDKIKTKEKEELAKELLNEILNSQND